MPDNVTKVFPVNARTNPDVVLEMAKGVCKKVLVLGITADNEIEGFSTTTLTCAEMIYLIEQFKHNLLSERYDLATQNDKGE